MHEHKHIQFDDLARVWYNAHLRRSGDFGLWLRRYFEDRRQAARHKQTKAQLLDTIISLVAPPHRKAKLGFFVFYGALISLLGGGLVLVVDWPGTLVNTAVHSNPATASVDLKPPRLAQGR